MKNELKKSVKTALLLVSTGLLITLFVFFLFFGKGLQLLMPLILFLIFFTVFLILEKLSFLSERLWLKTALAVILILIVTVLI